MAQLAIVVPTKDPSGDLAARCLAAVARTTAHLDVAVHPVVDSGPSFRFSRSINRGIAMSPDAEAWVLLNDDAFMDEGWLDAMLAAARAHPQVGVVGALLRYPDGRVQHAGGHVPLDASDFLVEATRRRAPFWGLRLIREQRGRPYPYMLAHWHSLSRRHRLDFVTGACYLVTRACHEKVGGFDERYEFGSEDVDHALRALEAGFELALATRATGIHLDGASSKGMSERSLRSLATFRATWDAQRIRRATRHRRGVYHP